MTQGIGSVHLHTSKSLGEVCLVRSIPLGEMFMTIPFIGHEKISETDIKRAKVLPLF